MGKTVHDREQHTLRELDRGQKLQYEYRVHEGDGGREDGEFDHEVQHDDHHEIGDEHEHGRLRNTQ